MAITFYRSVSHAEFHDIKVSGEFRPGGSAPYETGKYFTTSGAYAIKWGEAMEGVGNFKVVEADFTLTQVTKFFYHDRLDNIGPAYFVTFDQMGLPVIRTWAGSP